MPRIAGVSIPDNKQIEISLTYIYGIGRFGAHSILEKAKIDPIKKASELTQEEISRLKDAIGPDVIIEGDLRRKTAMNIKHLKDIKCWRGIRHIKNLPVRGQTTRINSRTARGNTRRTMGSGRKAPPSPK